jgi:hypothetical protein
MRILIKHIKWRMLNWGKSPTFMEPLSMCINLESLNCKPNFLLFCMKSSRHSLLNYYHHIALNRQFVHFHTFEPLHINYFSKCNLINNLSTDHRHMINSIKGRCMSRHYFTKYNLGRRHINFHYLNLIYQLKHILNMWIDLHKLDKDINIKYRFSF